MIKLICPKCMKPVPVADDFTGREVACPACGTMFDVPARYTPEVLSDPSGTATTSPARPEPPAPVSLPSAIPSRPTSPAAAESPSDRPVPPPGFVPPSPPAPPPIPTYSAPPVVWGSQSTPTPTVPGNYTKSLGITISPRVVAWLPAVLLTITFFCTFFPWIGSYLERVPRALAESVASGVQVGNPEFKLEQKHPEWLDKVVRTGG